MNSKKIPLLTGLLALVVAAGTFFSSGNFFNLSFGLGALRSEPQPGSITFNTSVCGKGVSLGNNKYSYISYTSNHYPVYLIVLSDSNPSSGSLATWGSNKDFSFYLSSDANGIEEFRFQNATSIAIKNATSAGALSTNFVLETRAYGQKTIYDQNNVFSSLTRSFTTDVNYISGYSVKNSGTKDLTQLVIKYSCSTSSGDILPIALRVVNPVTEFNKGDTFKKPESVLCTYSNGNDYEVKDAVEYSGFDSTKVGEQTITVTYNDVEIVSCSYPVMIKDVTPATDQKFRYDNPYGGSYILVLNSDNTGIYYIYGEETNKVHFTWSTSTSDKTYIDFVFVSIEGRIDNFSIRMFKRDNQVPGRSYFNGKNIKMYKCNASDTFVNIVDMIYTE